MYNVMKSVTNLKQLWVIFKCNQVGGRSDRKVNGYCNHFVSHCGCFVSLFCYYCALLCRHFAPYVVILHLFVKVLCHFWVFFAISL